MTVLDDYRAEAANAAAYNPSNRYVPGAAPVLLTGVQAVARLLVEHHAREERAGRRVDTFVSGYPGSPLGGLDKLLHSLPQLRTDYGVHLVPAVNEELGATAVWGSQLVPGQRNNDGVLGVWYGKGPGLDRAGDALRHGNLYGASADGGVLVVVGDDPASKSSSVPCASTRTIASYGMPVLTPRNATEAIRFGLYGAALSRLSGCWVGMPIVADVADGLWTVTEDFADLDVVSPAIEWEGRPWSYRQRAFAEPPESLLAEADLVGPRWAAVEAFGAANPLDAVEVGPERAWLGIAATGAPYDALRQALADLGLGDGDLHDAGIRLLRVGMPYPLGRETVRAFAADLESVLVIEEKASFLESQVKEVLYGTANPPRVLGKRDERGAALVPGDGQLTSDRLDRVLRRVLGSRVPLPEPAPSARIDLGLAAVSRSPFFCSGCPHNRSTVVPEGSLAGGGIGCHGMVSMHERPESAVLGLTQMGGEGAQWIGQAPFTDVGHLFQNIGDGTFFHSGQLAVQACVAANVNITYKILYNSAVAMTGAQDAEGGLTVAALTHKLAAEGVSRTVVVTDEPERYRRAAGLASGVTVRHRDALDAVQRELRDVPGVTVLIYDQQCANEARRLRKRGKQPIRTTRVVIDESVCEGCGDCGAKSNCLSVQPVDTELGRKTRIDQTTCNTDYSCLLGDCPSFLTVEVGTARRRAAPAAPPPSPNVVPLPVADLLLAGIGGTGIVTVNQILATAGLRSGRHTSGLDQVGLSQKAGPVTSHLRIGPQGPANRVSPAAADVVLGFDLLVLAQAKNLAFCSPQRTVAVLSTSPTPTGTQVTDASAAATDMAQLLARVRRIAASTFVMDAHAASEALFGSTAPANLLLVGAAYQLGALPVSDHAIEDAIGLNGVAVDASTAAFRWGRVAVADPAAFQAAVRPARRAVPPPPDLTTDTPLDGETRRLARTRAELVRQHSGPAAARRYLGVVTRAWEAEQALGDTTHAYSQAVARGVAHVVAYKDEYEVARLLTRPEMLEQVQEQMPGATDVRYNLQPPMLRALGYTSKLTVRASRLRPVLQAMAKARAVRGTPLDPFGRTHVRRTERGLARSHAALADSLSAGLNAANYARAVELAAAAELVRGYEDVKLRNVAVYKAKLAEHGA